MIKLGLSKVIVFVIGAYGVFLNQSVIAADAGFDPISLYGPEIRFDVLREGRPAGLHTVTFESTNDGVFVQSNFELKVDLLFVTNRSLEPPRPRARTRTQHPDRAH